MSTATTESPPKTAWPRRRWTTAEFDALLNGGFLTEGSKTFLWDGEIIEPMPENEPHANAQDSLYRKLLRLLPEEEWTIRPAHPLSLKDGYKPQPDLVVLPGTPEDYLGRVPSASDAALVIEIADSSYPQDSGEKLAEYANAGVPRYWIVNLRDRRIEAYSLPADGLYQDRRDYPPEAAIPLTLDPAGVFFGEIRVLDVLKNSLRPA